MKTSLFSILALVAGTAPVSAITVTTPASGSQLTSPFSLVASTKECDSGPAVAMGYSLDYGATTITKTSFSAMVAASDGTHTLHVKCWGPQGVEVDLSMGITIVSSGSNPPPNATVVSDIQSLPNWHWDHDPAMHGNASGTSDLARAPALSGTARKYSVSFTNSGGELYHTSFGKDPAATHFIYDARLWLDDASSLGNIEMDMNQVIANGDTVIFGVQCNGNSGTWDYALNVGTPDRPVDHWVHSNVACPDPRTWVPNAWHRVQIQYSRDNVGNVTYESISLDGRQSNFVGATGNGAFRLGWGPTLLTSFELDGHGAGGTISAYLDKLTISRW
ncbi:MAG: hypothetical protein ABSF53_07485 [Terracidiphilus sp.]